MRKLSEMELFAGILLMPVLPFLEDSLENVLAIVERAAECGARFIYPAFGMTLRQNQRDYYFQKLDELFPGLSEKYRRQYGNSYECRSRSKKAFGPPFQRRAMSGEFFAGCRTSSGPTGWATATGS